MTRQSLLTPTKTDYSDAHGNSEGAQQYKEKWIKIKHQRDENGNLKYPWDFEVVHGFSSRAICPQTILGLIILFKTWVEKSWEDIKAELIQLNNEAPDNVQYKLIFSTTRAFYTNTDC